jgi:DNA recombination protein RmuC
MDILSFLAGILLGALVLWFVVRYRMKVEAGRLASEAVLLQTDKAKLEERCSLLERQVQHDHDALGESRGTIVELTASVSTSRAEAAHLQEQLERERGQLQEMQRTMSDQFRGIADNLLLETARRLQEQHRERLEDILSPFRSSIDRFEKKIEDNQREAIRDNQSLKEQLLALQKLNQTIGEEARSLTTALKGQSKTQGGWGEVILERILEKSGLCRGREYTVQASHLSDDGRRLQPDVIIHLPENKHLVIDSKVSLSAFERFCRCDEPARKAAELAEHVESVRRHVKELAAKSYQRMYELPSLDFVLMFVPVEPAFNEAVNAEPDLYTDAFEQNIIIVSTSALLATLRTIASIWQQENQNRNAMEIARLGGELYDKFVGFLGDLQDLGRRLRSAQDSFDDALGKLSKGRGNLVRRAEELKKLGARTAKAIEPSMLDGAEEAQP